MTFQTEDVRLKYHGLPTETQVIYDEMEARLAKRGYRIHVDDIVIEKSLSEVVIRVTENFKLTAVKN